jgi:hypothetical protein
MGKNIENSFITTELMNSQLTEANESIVFRDVTGSCPENRVKRINALRGQTA